jgi:AcrR family transcriptional regulator
MTEQPAQSLAAQLRVKRSEMMITEIEAIALRLFEARGFDEVTVDEIASEAHISVRTFYRYFPAKEDVLQVLIARRSEALRAALALRPPDEPVLRSLRLVLADVLSSGDPALLRRWISVIASSPSVVKGVLGGIQLKSQRTIAEFVGSRLGMPGDALVPSMLAGAVGGVIQTAQTRWFFHGGDLATILSEGLELLEHLGSEPEAWAGARTAPKRRVARR